MTKRALLSTLFSVVAFILSPNALFGQASPKPIEISSKTIHEHGAAIRSTASTLDQINDQTLADAVTVLQSKMRALDQLLAQSHHSLKALAAKHSVDAFRLRQAILSLQASDEPILVFRRDALRYAPWIHIKLAEGYRRLGQHDRSNYHVKAAHMAGSEIIEAQPVPP